MAPQTSLVATFAFPAECIADAIDEIEEALLIFALTSPDRSQTSSSANTSRMIFFFGGGLVRVAFKLDALLPPPCGFVLWLRLLRLARKFRMHSPHPRRERAHVLQRVQSYQRDIEPVSVRNDGIRPIAPGSPSAL